MRKAVFLDRDGVLNETIVNAGVSHPPLNARVLKLLPGTRESVSNLKRLGYLCICVTNQPDFARGTRTRANIDSMNRKVRVLLGLDDLYVCLHDRHHNCECRKPRPGMLLEAARKWNIDLDASWMIGDRESDIEAGKRARCRAILLTPEISRSPDTQADYICRNLMEAVGIINGFLS